MMANKLTKTIYISFLVIFLLLPVGAYAAISGPISGDKVLSSDTEIVISTVTLGQPGAIYAKSLDTITATPGTLVSIDVRTPNSNGIQAGLWADGGKISLDKVLINAKLGVWATDPKAVYNGGYVSIGDNSVIHASDEALYSLYGSTIKVGDNATLVGLSNNGYLGSVSARLGGKIEIGNYASILNVDGGRIV